MWVDSSQDEENQNNQGNNLSVGAGGGTASQPVSSGGFSQPTGTTGNPSTITPTETNQPQQKFATVQDYLGANTQQGNQLGQAFTSNLTNAANTDKSAIDTAVAGATSDINAGTTNYDPNIVSKAQANPSAVANSPDDLNSFLKQWNAAYTGPSSFETSTEYTPAAAAANDASQKAAEVGTAGGQQQLLADQFNVSGQGKQALDQALLQNSSSAPTINAAAPAFQSVNDYLTSQSAALDAQAQQAAANTTAAKTQTQGAFANSLTGFQNQINAETTAAQNNAKGTATQWQSDLASGDPTKVAADLQSAGVDPSTIQSITGYLTSLNKDYGLNPNLSQDYTFNPAVDLTAANVATPQDYQTAAALSQLTGQDYSGVLNQANAAQAGTAGNPNQINAAAMTPELKAQLAEQDKEFLAKPVNIGTALPNLTDSSAATQYAQKYVDAVQRSGQDPKTSQTLQNLWLQAKNSYFQNTANPAVQNGLGAIIQTVAPVLFGK
jgi:hypothetical protein